MEGIDGGRGARGSFARSLLVAAAVGALLGRIGPFDTFSDLETAQRYAYWVGLTMLMWLQCAAAAQLLRPVGWFGRNPWTLRPTVAALIGAVPTAFEVAWAEDLLRVERDLGPIDLLALYGDVVLLAVPLLLATELLGRRGEPRQVPIEAAAPGADSILAKVPPERRGRLLALASEDHYLRVHTDRGEALIHHRFGEALASLARADGLQVHRSWWVARQAVSASEREGDRLLLVLCNGVRVPVSRTYVREAREAGLLEEQG